MADYWQDKRINHKHVACAWGLVVVVIAIMVALTSLTAGDCPDSGEVAAVDCTDGAGVRQANAERQYAERQ